MKIHLPPLNVAATAVFIGLLTIGGRPCAAGPIVEFDFVPAPGSLGNPTGVMFLDSSELICQPGSTFTSSYCVFDLMWMPVDNLDSPAISGWTTINNLNYPYVLTLGWSDFGVVQQWSVSSYEPLPDLNLEGGQGRWMRSSPDVADTVPTAALLIVSLTALGAVARRFIESEGKKSKHVGTLLTR